MKYIKDIVVILSSILGALIISFIIVNKKEEPKPDTLYTNQVVIKEASIMANTDDHESSLAEVINHIKNTVVDITASSLNSRSAGSGVIIGKDEKYSYIITNHHVIDNANTFKVELYTGQSFNADLVGSDPENDIAVLKIEASDLDVATFINDSDTLRVGETAIAIGNPLGTLGGTVSKGIISALDRELEINGEKMRLMQTDAAVNSGNSGGGLFNEDGLLIGIVNAKAAASGVEGLAFAIPANIAKCLSAELISTFTSENFGYIKGRTTIGATFVNGYYSKSWFERVPITYVYRLEQDGSASKAKLKLEDMIISVTHNGEVKDIKDSSEIDAIIKNSQVGDLLTFKVKRGGIDVSPIEIEVIVEQYIYKI